MKKFIALLALVSSQVFAAPQLAQVKEVQMIQEDDGAFLTIQLDRLPFENSCVSYNSQDRMYFPLQGSETEISILVGQSISTIAVGIPISLDTTGTCHATHGLEGKDLTFVRNINYEFFQKDRAIEDISEGFVYDAPHKNNTSDSQRIYVSGGGQDTFNCDIQAYVGSDADIDSMKMVAASTIPKSGSQKQECVVAFDVPPNSWWFLKSNPITDVFAMEFPDPEWTGFNVPPFSGYKEYRYKTWYGKRKDDQSLYWEGTALFDSSKSKRVPYRHGEYIYYSHEYKGKNGKTHYYSVKRKRDDSAPNGISEFKVLRELTKVVEPETETVE